MFFNSLLTLGESTLIMLLHYTNTILGGFYEKILYATVDGSCFIQPS